MPISREEFDQRRIDLSIPVAELLSDRPDLAFTLVDVQNLLAQRAWRHATLEDAEQALETLLSRGDIEVAEIEGQRWYAYTIVERRLGFL